MGKYSSRFGIFAVSLFILPCRDVGKGNEEVFLGVGMDSVSLSLKKFNIGHSGHGLAVGVTRGWGGYRRKS